MASDSTISIIELHKSEVQLLRILRNSLRFGEVTVKMRDGLPVRVIRIQEFINVGDSV